MSDLPPPPPPPPSNLQPPPGYVAYGAPGVMGRSFQRIRGLMTAMTVLLAIVIPLQILAVFTTVRLSNRAHDLATGVIDVEQFKSATRGNLTTIGGLLVIPIAVLTIIWMFRMASNVQTMGLQDATWKPGWAIGAWFLPPCVIYVLPWLMFKELWRASDPERPAYDPHWKTGKVSPLITVWWVLYGLVPMVGFVTAASFLSSFGQSDSTVVDFAKQYDKFRGVNVALAISSVAAGVVFLMLVRQLSERHMRATHEL